MSESTPITDTQEIREQLARIGASNLFRRRRKLIEFLEFLAAETMAGRAAQLTQNKIAKEFFGEADPSALEAGAAVRISASRLRDLLDKYFRKEASPDELRIHMPPRRYYLAFEPHRPVPPQPATGFEPRTFHPPSSKKISQSDIIGELGINLIAKRCLEMGFVWNQTRLEAGIDGYIEIRHETGEVTNCIIQVQSKATERSFESETTSSFEFRCSSRDLDYWLAGNAPVILVRSRPSTNEAYWISLKDYFSDLTKRKSAKIVFDKTRDIFDVIAKPALERLATRADSGLYLGTRPKSELVYSNLLELASVPEKYYVAATEYRTRAELFAALHEFGRNVPGEWILSGKTLTSFHDISSYPWTKVCERGTVEELETAEWSHTSDPVRQRQFVQLLNASLREKVYKKSIKFFRENKYYYFRATADLSDREYLYQSRMHRTSRWVFKGYPSRQDHSRMSYYRHSAFEGRFVRYGSTWYLQIIPTYHFTRDGDRLSRYAPELRSGIKRLETNQAVHGQVVMWAHLLTERSLFDTGPEFIQFGSLIDFQLDAGIDDDAWLGHEEDPDKRSVLATDERQRSFVL